MPRTNENCSRIFVFQKSCPTAQQFTARLPELQGEGHPTGNDPRVLSRWSTRVKMLDHDDTVFFLWLTGGALVGLLLLTLLHAWW